MEIYKGHIQNQEKIDYIVSLKNQGRSRSTHHSGFSNDPVTMNDILTNITGKPAKPSFNEYLQGKSQD